MGRIGTQSKPKVVKKITQTQEECFEEKVLFDFSEQIDGLIITELDFKKLQLHIIYKLKKYRLRESLLHLCETDVMQEVVLRIFSSQRRTWDRTKKKTALEFIISIADSVIFAEGNSARNKPTNLAKPLNADYDSPLEDEEDDNDQYTEMVTAVMSFLSTNRPDLIPLAEVIFLHPSNSTRETAQKLGLTEKEVRNQMRNFKRLLKANQGRLSK